MEIYPCKDTQLQLKKKNHRNANSSNCENSFHLSDWHRLKKNKHTNVSRGVRGTWLCITVSEGRLMSWMKMYVWMYPKEIPKQDRKLPHQTAYPHEIISARTARFVPILFSSVLKHLLQRLTHGSHSGNTYWVRALKYATAFSGEFH